MQAGVGTTKPRDYIMKAHRQIMSVRPKQDNLKKIADLIRHFDIVCLQEVDLGGFRSGFLNQAKFLKARAEFPYMETQINRRVGAISIHGNVILAKQPIRHSESYLLPGSVSGRGLLIVEVGVSKPLTIANTHLSLGEVDQTRQFDFISKTLAIRERVILAGDFNCTPDSHPLRNFDEGSDLDLVTEKHPAFPSWNPNRAIDHIFISKSFGPATCDVMPVIYSDHLPLALKLNTNT